MSQVSKYWRDAASIIVVAAKQLSKTTKSLRNTHPEDPVASIVQRVQQGKQQLKFSNYDYQVMLCRRTSGNAFMPNLYVFPGGAIDAADLSGVDWAAPIAADIFGAADFDKAFKMMHQLEHQPPPRPPLFASYHVADRDDFIKLVDNRKLIWPAELACRITALRELFEEVGLLIVYDLASQAKSKLEFRSKSLIAQAPLKLFSSANNNQNEEDAAILDSQSVRSVDLRRFQKEICTDGRQFAMMTKQFNFLPAVDFLFEWSNWLGPCTYAAKSRFDTIFYLCCLDHTPSTNVLGEIEEVVWFDPEEALVGSVNGNLNLAPPQIYELARLARFKTINELMLFASGREQFGFDRQCPLMSRTADNKLISIFPGDELYPSDLDVTACDQLPHLFDESALSLRERCKRLHRLQMWRSANKKLLPERLDCNLSSMPGNHIAPIPLPIAKS